MAAEEFRNDAPLLPEVIELSIETGLRQGELFNLNWGSLEQSGPNGEWAIRVEEQTRSKVSGGKPWGPKTRKTRSVPLSPRAEAIIRRLRGGKPHLADSQIIPNNGRSPYLRLHDSKQLGRRNVWRIFTDTHGFDVRWHDFRHACAVRRLQAGVPMHTVSRWLGHSDINLTVKDYGRFDAENGVQWAFMARGSEVRSPNAATK